MLACQDYSVAEDVAVLKRRQAEEALAAAAAEQFRRVPRGEALPPRLEGRGGEEDAH
jgi:hypothetical protein